METDEYIKKKQRRADIRQREDIGKGTLGIFDTCVAFHLSLLHSSRPRIHLVQTPVQI
jgi:hypothetical protein